MIQRLYVQRYKRAPLMSLFTVALFCCSQWFYPSLWDLGTGEFHSLYP